MSLAHFPVEPSRRCSRLPYKLYCLARLRLVSTQHENTLIRRKNGGFSLLELAIVLVVIGLLLGSLMFSLRVQLRQKAMGSTQHYLEEANDALIAWAMSQPDAPRLPCPDTGNSGEADALIVSSKDPALRVCPHQEGWLPWLTLGVAPADAWGRRVRYRVDRVFSRLDDRGADGLVGIETTKAAGDKIRVCADASCQAILGQDLVAVLISHGANGYGARMSNAVNPSGEAARMVAVPGNISADEWQNIKGRNAPTPGNNNVDTQDATGSGSSDFVQRPPTQGEHAISEFDDQVIWLPRTRLIGRLVAAGRLP